MSRGKKGNNARPSESKRSRGSRRNRQPDQPTVRPPVQQPPKQAERPQAPSTASIAQEILRQHHFAKDAGGRLYVFQNGVYVPRGDDSLRAEVKQVYERRDRLSSWSSHRANEVVKFVGVDAPELWERPPAGVVNLKNGLLQVSGRVLSPHNPKHLSPVQIPVAFDRDAKCPQWKRFIGEVFPADALDLAWEIAGYLLTPDTSIQKAFLLMGGGGNGKSTFLAGLRAFLGENNVATATLQELVHDRFRRVSTTLRHSWMEFSEYRRLAFSVY